MVVIPSDDMAPMSTQINLLLTADYELFLGHNIGSHQDVLFKPAQQLMQICGDLKVPITFFADVCSVWSHRRYQLNDYVNCFENQMRKASQSGHDVQLHLHPHWLHSIWKNGDWEISTEKMYLFELGFGGHEGSAENVVQYGVEYLQQLITPVNPDYRCIAFRAAGLALQPEDKLLLATLEQSGITIDSSIAKGLKITTETIEIDYTQMPSVPNWFMNSNRGVQFVSDRGIFEIPIGTFHTSLSTRMGFLRRRIGSVGMRRGTSISRSTHQTRYRTLWNLVRYNLQYLRSNPRFLLSFDTKGYSADMLLHGFDQYIKQHSAVSPIYVSAICHPKLMFEPQFQMLRKFVTALHNRYGNQINFVTYSDVWRTLSESS